MAVTGRTGPNLIGRTTESRDIEELVRRAVEGRGCSLLLCGEAGVGKTALLDAAVRGADAMTVLTARGIEAESEIPYSGLAELLRPLLGHVAELPQRQAEALAGALALGPPTGADPFAVGAATLSLLATAASARPVLAVVDDLQWVDAASVDAIMFAARRLQLEPVAALFAMRLDDHVPLVSPGIPILTLRGLDRDGVRSLLAAEADELLPEDVVQRLWIETDGNPLALIEILRLLPIGVVPSLEGFGEEPLPVAARIQQAYRRQVAGLSGEAATALLVAAANDSADVDPVLRAIGELGLTVADLEAAEATGLIAIEGERLQFRHPLARSSIYQDADPARRRAVHRALAQALEGCSGALAARRAWHLASATLGRDESVAAALEAAATSALRIGGFVAAARTWERAGRLSPGTASGARRLFAAAEAWHLANHYDRAIELLHESAALADDPALEADIEQLGARIDTWRGPALQACSRLRSAAERSRRFEPERAARMLADATLAGITGGDLRQALDAARDAQDLAGQVGGVVELIAALQLGKARILTGDVPGGYPLIMRAVDLLATGEPLEHDAVLVEAVPALMTVEEYALAERVLASVIEAERGANALGLLAYSLGARAELEVRIGRWPEAAADGAEAVQLAGEARQIGQLSYNLARLARLEAAQGREVECRSHADQAIELASRHDFGSTLPFAQSALGLLELGTGRIGAAIEHLLETGRLWESMGFREPGRLEWQADLAEALTRDGRRVEAEQALEILESEASACRRTAGDGRPDTACTLARASAARCRGLLARPDEAEPAFRESLGWHAWSATPFELGRTELCFGEQLRRAGRRQEARSHLAAALETFDRLGAEPWSSRAASEIGATGERLPRRRHRHVEELTPQELQVALLVATGMTNREAGAALFVTPKTIEFHLAKVYRKLDLRSRTELAVWAAHQQAEGRGELVGVRS